MTSERKLMDEIARKSNEWCRYLREKKGLFSTMPSEARNFAAIADHIATLTAENERLSARVARLEKVLKPFSEFAELLEIETDGHADDAQITVTIGNIADFAEFTFGDFRTARREMEEGK